MYTDELEFAKSVARAAGEIMLELYGHAKTEWKPDQTPVTEADIAINQLVIERVEQAFPGDGILGEEGSHNADSHRLWVVDPIDGTQTYDAGLPLSTFCLALVVNNTPTLGVVFDPFSSSLFHGIVGQGAFCNDQKTSVNPATDIVNQYCFISSRMNDMQMGEAGIRLMRQGVKTFNIRSVAYSLMNLSRGKSIAVIGAQSSPWDMAAAMVVLNEAGGHISKLDGSGISYTEAHNGFLASNTHTHQQILDIITKE